MKKNQFVLIFLTLVVMVAVWYIKTPINANKDPNGDGGDPVIKEVSVFKEMRDAIRNQRSKEVAALDTIIADATASISAIEKALSDKAAISDTTEKEILLEVQVINLGYEDAFVHATSNGVEVIVVAKENSATAALQIIDMVYSSFVDTTNVIVNFKTLEELKP